MSNEDKVKLVALILGRNILDAVTEHQHFVDLDESKAFELAQLIVSELEKGELQHDA
jgi:hypothetical protein